MAAFLFNKAKLELLKGNLDLENDTIKAILVSSAYTPNQDHNFISDVSGELSGTGYSRKTLANKLLTRDDSTDKVSFDADDLTYTALDAGEVAGVILYKEVTNDADSFLIAFMDGTGLPYTTNGGDFAIEVNSGGFFDI